MVGLGRMGGNMAQRLAEGGHEVVGFDVGAPALARLQKDGGTPAASLADLVAALPAPRAVWVMLPSGAITQGALDELVETLDAGDIVVDGGNAKYTESQARALAFAEREIDFIDVGVSGGLWGLQYGYGLMVGGPDPAVARLQPVFATLAPGEGGFVHAGPSGAGHFTKMIHNGIEYGLMQAYGEGFAHLAAATEFGMDREKLAAIAESWRTGTVIRSWLLDLATLALQSGDFDSVMGYVDDSGEGRWTVQDAVERGVPLHVISAALFSRFESRDNNLFQNRMIAALRNQFGGHTLKVE
jgi:6-phosphogluconate dehydrogenase